MSTIQEERKKCLKYIESIPKKYLLPRKKAVGMKDVVWKDGMALSYLDYWHLIFENSELQVGGRLKPKVIITSGGCITGPDFNSLTALMETYEMYLCSDGAIRCVWTPELEEKRWERADQLYNEEFAGWDASLKAEGYEWDEDEGGWKHAETGDIIYPP